MISKKYFEGITIRAGREAENFQERNRLIEVLENPFDIITLCRNMEIPLDEYAHIGLPLSKDFILSGLSETGYQKIKGIGVELGQIKKAEELAETGKESLASLYTLLTLGDLIKLKEYYLN